jgi:hypothetical protein
MINMPKSIKFLDTSDIADNLLHYKYNTKFLLSLIKNGVDEDDPAYLSSYRSFEGEVFENFIYEKLLRYAIVCDEIDKFVLKGFHQNKQKAYANTLSISEKKQIVYRTKTKEISEFDAIFTTKNNELYFVEMTLVKNVLKLRKRLRKKKALLEIIFPNYEIKSLIILNEGATGVKQFPSYCTVWHTKEFCAKKILEFIKNGNKKEIKRKSKINSDKMIEAHELKLHPFRYYNTMVWITKKLRGHKRFVLDMKFLLDKNIQRYHDLYNKFYIGYLHVSDLADMLNLNVNDYEDSQRVMVALEKKHTDEIVPTYYIQTSRKNLTLYEIDKDGIITTEKKDPYGITVTEVYHINRFMGDDKLYKLSIKELDTIKNLLL